MTVKPMSSTTPPGAALFPDRLRKAGLRATAKRLALLAILSAAFEPLPLKEIVAYLKKQVHQATVYRALKELADAGIVRRIEVSPARFEYVRMHHHHFICTVCGKMEDVRICASPSTFQRALAHSRQFTKLTDHALELFGVCHTCA